MNGWHPLRKRLCVQAAVGNLVSARVARPAASAGLAERGRGEHYGDTVGPGRKTARMEQPFGVHLGKRTELLSYGGVVPSYKLMRK